MRKLTLALILAALILAFAVVPAFAIMDPNVPADECNGNRTVGGAANHKGVNNDGASGKSLPIHGTNPAAENDDGVCPGPPA